MRTVQSLPLVLLFASTALLGAEQPRQESDLRFQDIAAGVWGFQAKGASCEDNPHTITFLKDGKSMILRYEKGIDGNPPTTAAYRILGEGPDYLRMQILDETETTAEGKLVEWDLLLLSKDSYCWRRTDWQAGGCTQPATRCKNALPTPKPLQVSGYGGYPLTPAVASMWGTIDEEVKECPTPITFMIYFRGKGGWHGGKSTVDVRLKEDPAVIQFNVSGIVLRAEYKKEARILRLFGKEISTDSANVILVDNIDQPGKEEVRQLGRADRCMPDKANPALFVLEHSEALRSAVLGN